MAIGSMLLISRDQMNDQKLLGPFSGEYVLDEVYMYIHSVDYLYTRSSDIPLLHRVIIK